jgi:hypothetical protein
LPEDDKINFVDVGVTIFDDMGNAYYCIVIAVWCTLFVESWKRKQNVIANMWLMRDFHDPTIER